MPPETTITGTASEVAATTGRRRSRRGTSTKTLVSA
jgi:hypothetical protein